MEDGNAPPSELFLSHTTYDQSTSNHWQIQPLSTFRKNSKSEICKYLVSCHVIQISLSPHPLHLLASLATNHFAALISVVSNC